MSTKFVLENASGLISGRRADPAPACRLPGGPLIIALHGGGYSSGYFDVPGYSLLDRAMDAGLSAIALDRPGYRESTLPEFGESPLDDNAEILDAVIAELWRRQGPIRGGVVLVGHSIGGAIATLLAAAGTKWPLLGLAVSGLALALPSDGPAYKEVDPAPDLVYVPDEVRSAAFFGRSGSYDVDAPTRLSVVNEAVIYREVAEINTRWTSRAAGVFAQVRVPVLYRLGDHDIVWAQGANELDKVRQAFSSASSVDARLVEHSGHVIDFHRAGIAHQDEQVSFAIACAKAENSS